MGKVQGFIYGIEFYRVTATVCGVGWEDARKSPLPLHQVSNFGLAYDFLHRKFSKALSMLSAEEMPGSGNRQSWTRA